MILLRVLGLIVSLTLLFAVVSRFRRGSLKIVDTLITGVLGVALAAVAIAPAAVDPVLRELGFPPGNARRVIGVLVLSNLLSYLLLLRAFAKTDRLESTLNDYTHRVATRAFVDKYGRVEHEPSKPGKLCVVIPTLNEETNLGYVLESIPTEIDGLKLEVIVVSDGSTDSTEDVAEMHGALVVSSDLRQGQGAAVSLGYRIALLRDASIIATLDADGQYVPEELPQLIDPIVANEADVVHGSRRLGTYVSPIRGRAQGVRMLSRVTSWMARTHITDPASGFRAFSAAALGQLSFRESQFHASEVTLAATKQGLRVKEVPCTFRERTAGNTKKPSFVLYGYGYTRSLLRTWLG
ncbi:MAG: glycosyltransferase family 2 protein [Actinobacteria bacterium]|nr:glycosyltransferase family 2 protein [Actinomycetota bacterium]